MTSLLVSNLRYEDLLEISTADELLKLSVRLAGSMGFKTISMVRGSTGADGLWRYRVLDNTPIEYIDAYHDKEQGIRDPVLTHCKSSMLPIVWDRELYEAKGAGDVWEEQAPYGYKNGIAVSSLTPSGHRFIIGIDGDEKLASNPITLSRMVADLQLFAVHAQVVSDEIWKEAPEFPKDRPVLTPRELETLKWTIEGKTAWEVGRLLGISERTAVRHIQAAMQKLNCFNKHQAAIKAMKWGMIS